jgi:hypothetical protein
VGADKKIEDEVGAVQGDRALHVQDVIHTASRIEIDDEAAACAERRVAHG